MMRDAMRAPAHYGWVVQCFNFRADPAGSCYTCAHFGSRHGVYVWCKRPGNNPVAAQPQTKCVFWLREPGADYGPFHPPSREDPKHVHIGGSGRRAPARKTVA